MARRWVIATLLFIATLLNYLDRQILALVSPVLRQQFQMSSVTYSHLLTVFLLGYTISQFFAGRLVDKLGARKGLLIAMIWWSSAGLLSATSTRLYQLGIFLFLMGIGEAANWPTGVRAIREWFPPETRAVGVGFFNSGSCAGAVLAPLVVATLTLHFSWRMAFAVCSLAGIVWVIPWLIAYSPKPPFMNTAVKPASLTHTFKDRRAWFIILARFFADPIWFFYVFWLPDYLARVQGLSLKQIGMTAWMPFLAAGIGSFTGGLASGYLIRKNRSAPVARLTIMGAAACLMAFGVVIIYVHGTAISLAIISVVVFAYSAWAANVLTLPADLFPIGAVATVVGASGTGAGLGGMLTTLIFGYVIEHYSYTPVFWMIAVMPFIAFTCSLLAGRNASLGEDKTVAADNQIA
jgi:ACS family hexuronate transporter-like MFS transporter